MSQQLTELIESLMRRDSNSTASSDDQLRIRSQEQQQKHRFENALASVMSQIKTADFDEIIRSLAQTTSANQLDAARVRALLQAILQVGYQRDVVADDEVQTVALLVQLYRSWRDTPLPRGLLLALLVYRQSTPAWQAFADVVVTDPPSTAAAAVEAFTPFWRDVDADFTQLFPKLWDALGHTSVAVIVLDLANYLFRSGRLSVHPATTHAAQLVNLLGGIVERLEKFESDCRQHGVTDVEVAKQVSEGVALAVALADCFARIEFQPAMGKLYRMLDLSHRRARTEAAAALAKLGETAGSDALVEMAGEPLVRLRVHAYAKELGIFERIAESHRSEAAVAEAELVMYLADPSCFGFAPASIELEDARDLYWPGYEEPQTCYLFRFTYRLPQGDLTNLALARPVPHVTGADLTDLDLRDVYAVYAGWHAEHDELRRVAIDLRLPEHERLVDQACQRLQAHLFHDLQPAFLADYFGTRIVVVSAVRGDMAGTVLVSPEQEVWVPQGSTLRPLTAEVAFDLFVGRDLLGRFNHWDDGGWSDNG